MRILCLDPGTANYGLSIINVKNNKLKIEGSKLVHNRVKDMKNPEPKYIAYKKELKELGSFDYVIAERFQSRGTSGGSTIESINIMLGALLELYPSKTTFITAATWKNRANHIFDLKDYYEDLKAEQASVRPISNRKTIHELDSSLMGLYLYYKIKGLDFFTSFEQSKARSHYLRMFLNCDKL